MARTARLPRGVTRLPTASREPVRQPNSNARYAAMRRGVKAGTVHRLPWHHFKAPEVRAAIAARDAEDAERRQLFEDGGIARTAPMMMLGAVLGALTPAQQQSVVAQLRFCVDAFPGEAWTKAALAYADTATPRRHESDAQQQGEI